MGNRENLTAFAYKTNLRMSLKGGCFSFYYPQFVLFSSIGANMGQTMKWGKFLSFVH